MDSRNLGRAIRQARLSKKLTQSEVVGTYITRNMLSQIESGAAMPSVKTLEYLCEKLDLQPEALMSDNTDVINSPNEYLRIRRLFEEKKYAEVIASPAEGEYSDELAAIRAKAYIFLAKQLLSSGKIADYQQAVEYSKKAEELSGIGIFSNGETSAEAREIVRTAASKLSEYYKSLI
ncbi:MAG: helix-turn-helix transcriptional regulator [Ruminococcus sp.]|nr:helix-turn-helix transcriptional regulator [Ruminococcus sp.]